jgi:hypothetical protein
VVFFLSRAVSRGNARCMAHFGSGPRSHSTRQSGGTPCPQPATSRTPAVGAFPAETIARQQIAKNTSVRFLSTTGSESLTSRGRLTTANGWGPPFNPVPVGGVANDFHKALCEALIQCCSVRPSRLPSGDGTAGSGDLRVRPRVVPPPQTTARVWATVFVDGASPDQPPRRVHSRDGGRWAPWGAP